MGVSKNNKVLPNDSVRLADENSLLITDIIVELDDGSLANIEIQRIGYAFPGERMACYQADMLLRQYKRVKERRKNKFTYRDIKNVYMIIFFEKSTKEFHDQKEEYIHYGKTTFDSGLQLKTPQNYILIPLDIFKEKTQNKAIESELEAWLTFLGSDEPERIAELLERYPDFRVMYEEIYQICSNIEGVMSMFSEELRELDRNTVQYMIEEQEKILKRQEKELKEQEKELKEQKKELKEQEKALKEQSVLLEDKDAEIAALRRELEAVSNKKGTASSSK